MEKISQKIIQIEKVPETVDTQKWTKFNERINDLINQGFIISFTEDRYIVLNREKAVERREE
jgi:hypothetical protein